MRRLIFAAVFLFGCGGNSVVVPPPHVETLTWEQPPVFSDNTPMDIHRDVARWDVYASPTPTSFDGGIVGTVVKPDFDLLALRGRGIVPGDNGLYLSVKCVGIDNQQSSYSVPVLWAN
jgi:hypothetical protein